MNKCLSIGCLVMVIALFLPSPFALPVKAASNLGAWTPTGSLDTARSGHTSTLLPDGRVLVTGGGYVDAENGTPHYFASAELYDPVSGTWSLTASMSVARGGNTATLLLDGRVLVVGGDGDPSSPASAEIYDPPMGTWSPTGSLNEGRVLHTATLLADGRVLVAGGIGVSSDLVSVELYDPATGTWSLTGSLGTRRDGHTATLLPDGRVLVVGGYGDDGYLASAEVYDPALGIWSPVDELSTARWYQTATLLSDGRVLVAGGFGIEGALADAQLYDPTAAPGSAWSPAGTMNTARGLHLATLLPNGHVLVAGGEFDSGPMADTEVYDPLSGTWTPTGAMGMARVMSTAALLASGRVLVVGGRDDWNGNVLAAAEVYEPAETMWSVTGSLNDSRTYHTATLLSDGQVLAAGGQSYDGGDWLALDTAETYDPEPGTWSETAAMNSPRARHTATTLPGGQVLVAGGWNGAALADAEIYDPAGKTWISTGSMGTARAWHTATLLPDDRVLVAGGDDGAGQLSAAEVYDAMVGTWIPTGSLSTARTLHTATLLPDGRVLVTGGLNAGLGWLSSAELYDPATGTWSPTGSMAEGRGSHTATLLPDGRVLVAGGMGWGDMVLDSAEVYDPASGSWSATGSMVEAREGHQAILLPDGQVLIAGGLDSGSGGQASTEVYDPATGMWRLDAPWSTALVHYGLTLLADGRLLRSGGWSGDDSVADAELYDRGLGFDPAWRPSLAAVTSPLLPGSPLTIAGSGLRGYGLTEASSGTSSSSATNYPLVQLRRVDNGQVRWLLPDPDRPFSATAFTALPVASLPGGPYLLTVFVNGITSVSQMITASETNLPPIAHDDAYTTDENASLSVVAPGVLTNDFDGDLPIQTLTAALDTGPVHGDLVLNPDGSFLYTPDQNFSGADDFSYTVSDGELDSTAVVSLTVRATGEPGLADLALAKTASAAAVRPGVSLTYTLALTNTGPSDSMAITVTDWLPLAVSLLDASRDCFAAAGMVTCLPGSLAAGETTILTLTVRVNVTATGTLSNTAWITAAEPDPEPANNTASAAVQLLDFFKIYLPLLVRGGE